MDEIIDKILLNQPLTKEEKESFELWWQEKENRQTFYDLQRINSALYAHDREQQIDTPPAWKNFTRRIKKKNRILRFLPYVAAALVILTIGVSLYLLFSPVSTKISEEVPQIDSPEQQQIILTLSNGKRIVLNDSLPTLEEKDGSLIQQSEGELSYQVSAATTTSVLYNTITVPRGGEYKLILADSSIVWINSESELVYPVNFSSDIREVKLKGEAFFEVRKSKKPFWVKTDQFDIQVTGTQFNVRNYPKEISSVTLAEGSILMEKEQHIIPLSPGQQASLIDGKIEVHEVSLEEAIGWRYGFFCFKERPLESLLNEVARYYDVDIVFQDNDARYFHFTAWFRRSIHIQELINILEKTQRIKLELKGKTLIVKTKLT